MGCDYYHFVSKTGKGRIIETTYKEIKEGYPFRKSLFKSDGNGGYDGTIVLIDEEISDDEPYICVIFEGEILKNQFDCPGPYEIEEHFVSIRIGEDNRIIMSSSAGFWEV